jgi:hypothetical protein
VQEAAANFYAPRLARDGLATRAEAEQFRSYAGTGSRVGAVGLGIVGGLAAGAAALAGGALTVSAVVAAAPVILLGVGLGALVGLGVGTVAGMEHFIRSRDKSGNKAVSLFSRPARAATLEEELRVAENRRKGIVGTFTRQKTDRSRLPSAKQAEAKTQDRLSCWERALKFFKQIPKTLSNFASEVAGQVMDFGPGLDRKWVSLAQQLQANSKHFDPSTSQGRLATSIAISLGLLEFPGIDPKKMFTQLGGYQTDMQGFAQFYRKYHRSQISTPQKYSEYLGAMLRGARPLPSGRRTFNMQGFEDDLKAGRITSDPKSWYAGLVKHGMRAADWDPLDFSTAGEVQRRDATAGIIPDLVRYGIQGGKLEQSFFGSSGGMGGPSIAGRRIAIQAISPVRNVILNPSSTLADTPLHHLGSRNEDYTRRYPGSGLRVRDYVIFTPGPGNASGNFSSRIGQPVALPYGYSLVPRITVDRGRDSVVEFVDPKTRKVVAVYTHVIPNELTRKAAREGKAIAGGTIVAGQGQSPNQVEHVDIIGSTSFHNAFIRTHASAGSLKPPAQPRAVNRRGGMVTPNQAAIPPAPPKLPVRMNAMASEVVTEAVIAAASEIPEEELRMLREGVEQIKAQAEEQVRRAAFLKAKRGVVINPENHLATPDSTAINSDALQPRKCSKPVPFLEVAAQSFTKKVEVRTTEDYSVYLNQLSNGGIPLRDSFAENLEPDLVGARGSGAQTPFGVVLSTAQSE